MRISLSLAAAILTVHLLAAQTISGRLDPPFRSEAKLMLVPANVTDHGGAYVPGLAPEDFHLTQDNSPCPIASVVEEDGPVSVGVIFDMSGSMATVALRAQAILRQFVDSLSSEDEGFLFTVSNRPGVTPGFTNNLSELPNSTLFAGAKGSTALLDTIHEGIFQMRSAHYPRRALLVISDGMDNHSRYTTQELLESAVESSIEIYSIAVYEPPLTKKPMELSEERAGLSLLTELARKTGGVSYVVHDMDETSRTVDRVARIIQTHYLIGFTPQYSDGDGKWHSLSISVNDDRAHVYSRTGFYAR